MLRAAGAVMAIPMLEAMRPAIGKQRDEVVPRRMVAINVDLGFMPDEFFPKSTGKQYELSPYLRELKSFRQDFTVFSGLSHPEVDGGHEADVCFLTGAPHPRSAGFRNTVSLDQYAAAYIGHQSRFPSLNLRVGPGNGSISFTADGVRMPAEMRPSRVYQQLFVQGSPAEVRRRMRALSEGQSVMDSFADQIGKLRDRVSGPDKQRLDQYFQSVRDVEQRLEVRQRWQQMPKPKTNVPMPKDNLEPGKLFERTRAMYDLTRLALETDSTRLVTILVTQNFNPKVDLPGVDMPHHALTHQSQNKKSREQLKKVEAGQMKELAGLLKGLRDTREDGDNLLDRTMVMQGSAMGHAGKHDNHNLPILLAGGGFRHGRHLAFDREHNEPLANLYVTMLQRLGIETDRFASGTGTLRGIEQKA
ncbi:MAG: DUF1552 domain-containing protein [Planctomycetota bacterium]